MIRALKSLWNNQYKKGIAPVPPRFDFKLKTGAIPEYLSREELFKLLEIKGQYESVDVWLLLYFFRGMNFKDLALLKDCQIVNNRVYYTRSKTGKEVPSFAIHEYAQDIISRYSCKENDYTMPYVNDSIHKSIRSKEYRVKKVRGRLLSELRDVFAGLGIKEPFRPFYSARYTFALHLSEHPKQDLFQIKRALGHQSIVTTEKYIRRLNMKDLDKYIDESMPF